MNYCYECGTKLKLRYLEGEGEIPYCNTCETFRFPIYSTAVSMEVINPTGDKVLLIQQYGRKNNILVAGYINKGENAEDAVVREVKEEIGIDVKDVTFQKSAYFEKSNTLLFNFSCTALTEDLSGVSTKEVDQARWFTMEEAKEQIIQVGLAREFFLHYLKGKESK